jgi:NodT family efflux transporter outer membrane factor (OMF) lipoprotein
MRRHPVLFVLFILPPLLASCALGPKVPAPNASLPTAFEAPGAGAASTPIDRWWTLYNDPQLESLVDQALVNAPDARSAAERLREARATRSEALAAFMPQGSLQGSASRVDTTEIKGPPPVSFGGTTVSLTNAGITDSYGANFDVSWELDLFGRSFVTRRKANADLAAARFDYEASRTSLAASVADQLFQARGLAIQLEDARDTARIQHDLADVARKKADHGLGPRSDADQSASQAAQTDAQVADLETQLHAAKRTLLVLLGRGAEPVANLDAGAGVGEPPAIPATVPGELLARRPDVREAAAQITSAAGTLKLDELALFPKFTLQPGVGLSDSSVFGTPSISDSWSIGLGLVQPILDIPRLEAEIRAQGARADQAVIAYEKAVQTAYGEADNALVQLGSDETRVRLLTAGEAEGLSAYQASKTGYTAGIVDLTTVLSAEQTWRAARTALTGAKVQALRRSVQAFKALGGGWSAPELADETHGAGKGAR